MTTTTGKKNLGFTYGLFYGGASIVFTLVLYLGGVKLFVHPIAFLGLVIPIVFGVLGGLAQKKANGGYLEFSEALKTVFTVLVVGSLLGTLFQYLLFNIIDVPFREALAQETAVVTEKMMKGFGASQADIDKAIEQSLNGNSYTIGKMFLGFALWCIPWFIVSLIIAAIIKKKKPEFDI